PIAVIPSQGRTTCAPPTLAIACHSPDDELGWAAPAARIGSPPGLAEAAFPSSLWQNLRRRMPDWIKASKAIRLNTMAAVACAMVVGALLFWNAWTFAYIFWIGTSPLPFADQWDAALFPDRIIRNLFALHNEHRPVLGRLVDLLDWYLVDARNVVNAAFT